MNDKLKVFIASSFMNKLNTRSLMRFLRRSGFQVVSTWVFNPTSTDHLVLREEAITDYSELTMADVLVVLLPGRLGTSTELGIALAQNKPIIVMNGPAGIELEDSNVYFFYPGVKVVSNRRELVEALNRCYEYTDRFRMEEMK